MKSERRHELKENVLNAELGKALGFFRTHGKLVAWAVFGVALVLVVYVTIQNRGRNKERDAQADFARLVMAGAAKKENLPQLETMVDNDSNAFRASNACVAAGDVLVKAVLDAGSALTPTEKAEYLERAKTFYGKTVDKFPDQAGADAKAYLSLATAMELEKGLPAARKPLEQAATLKGTTVAGVIAQGTLQEWDTISATVPMRQAPLAPPSTQPAGLLPQNETPLPGVPLPQGFRPEAAGATSKPASGAIRFVGEPSEIAVVNFYRAQMTEQGWKTLVDRQQTSFTLLVFTKGPQYLVAKIGRSGLISTQIELLPGTGAVPAAYTSPAAPTAPAAPVAPAAPATVPAAPVKK